MNNIKLYVSIDLVRKRRRGNENEVIPVETVKS